MGYFTTQYMAHGQYNQAVEHNVAVSSLCCMLAGKAKQRLVLKVQPKSNNTNLMSSS